MSQGEIETVYRRHAERVRRLVAVAVTAPDAVIEDACQVAWGRLVDHRERVRAETALAWVAQTALREALKATRGDGRTCPIDVALEHEADSPALQVPGADEATHQRHHLTLLQALPRRQQRLLWLQGFGFTYAEMAIHERCTRRTVERQLLRARRAVLRASAA